MPIEFACPKCGVPVRASDRAAGRPGMCPGCDAVIDVPKAGAAVDANLEGRGRGGYDRIYDRRHPEDSQLDRAFSILTNCHDCLHAVGFCVVACAMAVFFTRPAYQYLSERDYLQVWQVYLPLSGLFSLLLILSWYAGRAVLRICRVATGSLAAMGRAARGAGDRPVRDSTDIGRTTANTIPVTPVAHTGAP